MLVRSHAGPLHDGEGSSGALPGAAGWERSHSLRWAGTVGRVHVPDKAPRARSVEEVSKPQVGDGPVGSAAVSWERSRSGDRP
ncbi:hypothetical protein SHJG_1895 [Streptomyces hygroscopicus subsp. jinggangensis 5008]|nr:hypothetical protein SHJG_1895 [Streptomyces hygroscopicus subsp. jinggangensis 5008]AGF61326.1 hypothetical protein SHJGH_1660 [Streptomyces hygroscopicus subsp. jinggangensis TL01]